MLIQIKPTCPKHASNVKTSAATTPSRLGKLISRESLAVQCCIVPAGQTILLKPVKKSKNIRDGFLRVHNVSNRHQTILPSKTAQKQWPEFQPEIVGDDFHASMPMAWNNPALRFEIISMNNSLLPDGTRVLLDAAPPGPTTPTTIWGMTAQIGSSSTRT